MKRILLLVLAVSGCAEPSPEGVLFSAGEKSYLLTHECVEKSAVLQDQERRHYVRVDLNDSCAVALAEFLNSRRGELLSASLDGRYLSRLVPILGEFEARNINITSPDAELAADVHRVLSMP